MREPPSLPIQADIVGAETRRQRIDVQKLEIEFIDFEPHVAGLLIPIETEGTGHPPHGGGARGNGGRGGGLCPDTGGQDQSENERSHREDIIV